VIQSYHDIRELAQLPLGLAELKAGYQICDKKLKSTLINSMTALLIKFREVEKRHG